MAVASLQYGDVHRAPLFDVQMGQAVLFYAVYQRIGGFFRYADAELFGYRQCDLSRMRQFLDQPFLRVFHAGASHRPAYLPPPENAAVYLFACGVCRVFPAHPVRQRLVFQLRLGGFLLSEQRLYCGKTRQVGGESEKRGMVVPPERS